MSDTNATPKKTSAATNTAKADEVVIDSSSEESGSGVDVVDGAPLVVAEDHAVVDHAGPDHATADHADAASTIVVVEPVPARAGEDTLAHTGEVDAVHAPVQTVYVTAPNPPRPKGNRGMGILMSLIATAVFAALYVAVAAVLTMFMNPNGVTSTVSTFLTSPMFFVPVLVFLVIMIIWALLANRASWWSWVIGSFVIAAVTYFASIGVFLLMQGGFGMTASGAAAAFAMFALNPALIAATLIARECAIWFGAAIAKRGRKVRERNYEAWQTFEHEEAQKRAEFGGAAAA